MAAHDGALPGTRVRVTRAGDHLVVRLGSRFTEDDLDVVRRIRGRRWLPDERAWLLPDTQ
ncbi:MAG TPA: hypothetical protein VK929_02055 [Longimicrobiales bacterium]|nr:hypothetical protein [Longimicrobiales bacterium]